MQTPQENVPELAKAIGVASLYLKREDLHPFGSHKGRSIPLMMAQYAKDGIRDFVISSSGNAAIAAAKAQTSGCTLKIFVGKKIDPNKLKTLSDVTSQMSGVRIEQVDRPKQSALQYAKKTGAVNLRQSTDDMALAGYASLADELKEIPSLQAVFIPTSSGTTAQALGAFLPGVQIHIVQTEAVYPIAELFDLNFTKAETSEASAIVDNVAHRKDAVVEAIKKSGGSGWIVSDGQINEAMMLVKETIGTDISPNSALSIAGLKKAVDNGRQFSGTVVCLITGA